MILDDTHCTIIKASPEILLKYALDAIPRTEKQDVFKVKDLFRKIDWRQYYHYYGISYNARKLRNFYNQVQRRLFKALNRRSSRRSYDWEGFKEMQKCYPLAQPKIYYLLY